MISAALIALVVLWWGLITYAVLGGADFGAGVWDLVAFGKLGQRQHKLINRALGPVWEANHTWLIFLIVGLFNIFPSAFAAFSTALFVPLSIVLVGIVLRGAAFVFRYYAISAQGPFAFWWGRVFSFTSIITPFFLGASAAAVASGHLLATNGTARADLFASWTSPFALAVGAMAVGLCATTAAVYLTVEAKSDQDEELTESYRRRALSAGAVTSVFGALALYFSTVYAPIIWQGMLAHAIPVVIATMLIGLGTATALFVRRYRLARILIIAEAAFLLGSWGLSQYPYIIPPHYTIDNSANQTSVIVTLLIGIGIGLLILIPSLYYLFSVFKLPYPAPGIRPEVEKEIKRKAEAAK
jgi:cytochrome bd ubiquinol oxidase subunit II